MNKQYMVEGKEYTKKEFNKVVARLIEERMTIGFTIIFFLGCFVGGTSSSLLSFCISVLAFFAGLFWDEICNSVRRLFRKFKRHE